jgi:hypothetical protein
VLQSFTIDLKLLCSIFSCTVGVDVHVNRDETGDATCSMSEIQSTEMQWSIRSHDLGREMNDCLGVSIPGRNSSAMQHVEYAFPNASSLSSIVFPSCTVQQ